MLARPIPLAGRRERNRSPSVLQGLPWDPLPTSCCRSCFSDSPFTRAPVPSPYLVCSQQLAADGTHRCSGP